MFLSLLESPDYNSAMFQIEFLLLLTHICSFQKPRSDMCDLSLGIFMNLA